jgi:hypothetical protein
MEYLPFSSPPAYRLADNPLPMGEMRKVRRASGPFLKGVSNYSYIINSLSIHLEFLKLHDYLLNKERGCFYGQQDKSNPMRLFFS